MIIVLNSEMINTNVIEITVMTMKVNQWNLSEMVMWVTLNKSGSDCNLLVDFSRDV